MSGGFPIGHLANCTDIGTVSASTRGTSITTGNGSYGSYVQLSASIPFNTGWVLVHAQTNAGPNAAFQTSLKLAIGAAASEVAIVNDLIIWGLNKFYSYPYCFPLRIPAGTRISAAGYSPAGADGQYCSVLLFADGYGSFPGGGSGVDSIGWSAGLGTAVTTGAANSKGSYTQITSSTSKAYSGIIICVDFRNTSPTALGNALEQLLLDVAVGGSGSEVNIVSNYVIGLPCALGTNSTNDQNRPTNFMGSPSPYLPIPIPAGTRLSVRLQDVIGSKTYGITIYGVY